MSVGIDSETRKPFRWGGLILCRHVSTESLESSEIIDKIEIIDINQKPRRKERDPHKTKADKPFHLLHIKAALKLYGCTTVQEVISKRKGLIGFRFVRIPFLCDYLRRL